MFAGNWKFGRLEAEEPFALRRRVFVEERGIPEAEEFDPFDDYAAHIFVYDQESKAPIATGRIYPDGEDTRIGRIAVAPEFRAEPYDELVLRTLLDKAQRLAGKRVLLDADAHDEALCRPFGFAPVGEPFYARGAQRRTVAVGRDAILWDSKCKHM